MKLSYKLILGYLLVASLASFTTYFALSSYRNIDESFETLMRGPAPTIKSLEDLKYAGTRIVASTSEICFVLSQSAKSDNNEIVEEERKLIASGVSKYQESLKRYEDLTNAENPSDVKFLKAINEQGNILIQTGEQIIRMNEDGIAGEKILEKKEAFEEQERAYLRSVDDALTNEYKELEDARENVQETITQAARATLIVTFLTFILAIISGLYISRHISNRIIKLKEASEEVGRGHLETIIEIKTNDEIGGLARSFNKMVGELKSSGVELAAAKDFSDKVMNSMVDFVVVVDMDLTILRINKAGLELTGYEERELTGKSINLLIGDRPFNRKGVDLLRKYGSIADLEKLILRKDGSTIPISMSASVLKDNQDRESGMVCVGKDISERRRTEEAMAQLNLQVEAHRQRLDDTIANMPSLVWEVAVEQDGSSANFSFVNDYITTMLGYTVEEWHSSPNFWLDVIHPEDREKTGQKAFASFAAGEECKLEFRWIAKDGRVVWVDSRFTVICNDNGKPVGLRGINVDITERKLLEEQLTHQALHDSLTKLANRVLFHNRVEHALARVGRNHEPIAVLFLDLDNFKTVNDTLGHEAGDTLLVSVAERLVACLRPSDTVARLGGDEFAILLESTPHIEEVTMVAERLNDVLRESFSIDGKEISVHTSIGIAVSIAGNEKTEDLLRNADVAMYKAKSQGKDQYVFFENRMREDLMKRVEFEADLRRAVERQEFVLHYQPIINLQTEQIIGMEALVRWNHPQRGLIPPDKFIPVAEETGLIVPLGQWVLEEACRQARKWQIEFGDQPNLSITVNLSNKQVQEENLIQMVASALAKSNLPAHNLILEITESTMLHDTEATIRKLTSLKELGIRLAIDDFGTGYSSMSYLQRFPIDVLKIDKSFVDKINQGKEGAAVARAIITMSETLHLKTIAEGIETDGQNITLQGMGCEFGQGYHFARPLTKEAMSEFLSRKSLSEKDSFSANQTGREKMIIQTQS